MSITKSVKNAIVAKINALPEFAEKAFVPPVFDTAKTSDDGYLEEYANLRVMARKAHALASNAPSEVGQMTVALASLLSSFSEEDLREICKNSITLALQTKGLWKRSDKDIASAIASALRGNAGDVSPVIASRMLAVFGADKIAPAVAANGFSESMYPFFQKGLSQMIFARDPAKGPGKSEEMTLKVALEAIRDGSAPWVVVPEKPAPAPEKKDVKGGKGK